MRWLIVCAVFILLATAGGRALPVSAQPLPPPIVTPPPTVTPFPTAPLGPPPPVRPLANGDLLWAFAGEPPLTDERVQLALATVILNALDAGGLPGGRSDFMIHRLPVLGRGTYVRTTPRAQLPLLLAAAGLSSSTIREVGQCVVTVLPPPAGVMPVVEPSEAARRLGVAVRDGLRELGVTVQACAGEVGGAPGAGAQIVAWYAGGPDPQLPIRPRATWLTAPGLDGPRPAPTGPAGAPPLLSRAPGAPAAGNAGVARDGRAGASLLFGALIASIAAARVLTGRERSHGSRRD